MKLKTAEVYPHVLSKIVCTNVFIGGLRANLLPKGVQAMYLNTVQAIVVKEKFVSPILMLDLLFHEDRHHQQHQGDTLPTSEEYVNYSKATETAYRRQHIEKDARRYAYVQTCKTVNANPALFARVGFWIYKQAFHPFKGLLYKLKG